MHLAVILYMSGSSVFALLSECRQTDSAFIISVNFFINVLSFVFFCRDNSVVGRTCFTINVSSAVKVKYSIVVATVVCLL